MIGRFDASAFGLRDFGGITVGIVGAAVGVYHSLADAALGMLVVGAFLFMRMRAA